MTRQRRETARGAVVGPWGTDHDLHASTYAGLVEEKCQESRD